MIFIIYTYSNCSYDRSLVVLIIGHQSTMSKLSLCFYGILLSCVVTAKVDSSNSISRKNERFLHRYLNAANILQKATVPTYCTDSNLTPRVPFNSSSGSSSSTVTASYVNETSEKIDVLCQRSVCPEHSFCFMGSCACHPGYTSISKCLNRSSPVAVSNPWWVPTTNCHFEVMYILYVR